MMIKYNGTNVHALGHMQPEANRQAMGPPDISFLRPGWNEFPKTIWAQYQEHPDIKKMLKKGKLEVMAEKVVVNKGAKKVTKVIGQDDKKIKLMELPEAKALQVAKGTFDRDLLQRWLDEETRHLVKRALTKQIEPLLGGESESEASEEEAEEENE